MEYIFEGTSEEEVIERASTELGLARGQFDVEVREDRQAGADRSESRVVIQVWPHAQADEGVRYEQPATNDEHDETPQDDFETAVIDFVRTVALQMGYPAEVRVAHRSPDRVHVELQSEYSRELIGPKGRTLDALQLLANATTMQLAGDGIRVVVDTENYRSRREESLLHLAHKIGDQVLQTGRSQLLYPMNPYERRLIHRELSRIHDLATRSEGDGFYKQIRVHCVDPV